MINLQSMFGLNLTKLEFDILEHRLEAADGISDYLCGEYGLSEEEVSQGFDDIAAGRLTEPAKLILKDCVEGSTYYGAAKGDVSRQKEASILAAGRSLAKKIGNLIGESLRYPQH